MPRGRCHFALVLGLQEQLERDLPEIGALTGRYLPELVAGSMAPDAMRLLGKMGKYGSHFYAEERRETWGKSVSGMFERISRSGGLSEYGSARSRFVDGVYRAFDDG